MGRSTDQFVERYGSIRAGESLEQFSARCAEIDAILAAPTLEGLERLATLQGKAEPEWDYEPQED